MIWIWIAKIVLMKRDSQDLLEEFEKVATYGGNGSSNCIFESSSAGLKRR